MVTIARNLTDHERLQCAIVRCENMVNRFGITFHVIKTPNTRNYQVVTDEAKDLYFPYERIYYTLEA